MDNSAQTFHLPQNVPGDQQVPFCLSVIRRQREEILPLRKKLTRCQTYHDPLLEKLKEWREKYEKAEKEITKLKQKNKQLEKEKGELEHEIEKLTASNAALAKTNERYRVSLFDHGNFTHPMNQSKKPKGGQPGHADTNRDGERNYSSFTHQRIFAAQCGGCGGALFRAGGVKEKTLIDIKINTETLQLIIESERQWCRRCHKEIRVCHPQSLPFTEYGMNTFMVVMHLRFKGRGSLRAIAVTLNNLFGLPISKAGVGTLLSAAKDYLGEKYEQLKVAIRNSEVMYNDETGWSMRGKSACMWIMVTPDKTLEDGTVKSGVTVYVAAESKGKGIFEQMYGNSHAYSMHDGNPSYEGVTGKEKTLYCWSHVLRFCFEETIHLLKGHLACQIRERLLTLYQAIRIHREWTRKQKERVLRQELDSILAVSSSDQTVQNIQHRIATQKEGLILSLLVTEDGTNNLAEREFRGLAISRTVSYGSDTYGGMETTAILASIVQTVSRDKTEPFLSTLKSYLQEGVQKKYPQYKHVPVIDT